MNDFNPQVPKEQEVTPLQSPSPVQPIQPLPPYLPAQSIFDYRVNISWSQAIGRISITLFAILAAFILFFQNTADFGDLVHMMALPMFILTLITACSVLGYSIRDTKNKGVTAEDAQGAKVAHAVIRGLSVLVGLISAAIIFFGGLFLAFAASLSNVHEGGGT